MSKYGVISGPYFPVFGLKTEKYSVSLRIQSESEYKEIQTINSSVFGHFSRSERFTLCYILVNYYRINLLTFYTTLYEILLQYLGWCC